MKRKYAFVFIASVWMYFFPQSFCRAHKCVRSFYKNNLESCFMSQYLCYFSVFLNIPMKTKITIRYYYGPPRMTQIKKKKKSVPTIGENVEKQKLSNISGKKIFWKEYKEI